MSIEAYERKSFDNTIFLKLKEAELEAKSTETRLSHDEVLSDLRSRIIEKIND